MFARWGAFVYRSRRVVVLGAIAFALVMGFFGLNASSHLSSGGWLDTSSESAAVDQRLASEFGGGKSSLIALFHTTTPNGATSGPFQAAVTQTLAPLAGDSDVSGVVGYAQTRDPRFISTDGDCHLRPDPAERDGRAIGRPGRFGPGQAGRTGRLQLPADRLRTADQGGGRPVREGPGPGRNPVPADRGPDPDPGLRLPRGRLAAAPGSRPGDPHDPRADLLRQPADRDERIRHEHRDDARSGPLDRLLPIHGQPVPRRARSRSNRR